MLGVLGGLRMDWLQNPWVIGVGGGVISGLLVTLITRYLFARRERREYRQKVATANHEIIYTIRPAVAEKVIPSAAMVEALFSATARKYEVNSDDLLSISALANELMKEVMDNTFLTSNQKRGSKPKAAAPKAKKAKPVAKAKKPAAKVAKRGRKPKARSAKPPAKPAKRGRPAKPGTRKPERKDTGAAPRKRGRPPKKKG